MCSIYRSKKGTGRKRRRKREREKNTAESVEVARQEKGDLKCLFLSTYTFNVITLVLLKFSLFHQDFVFFFYILLFMRQLFETTFSPILLPHSPSYLLPLYLTLSLSHSLV